MNCIEFQELLQRCLDGEALPSDGDDVAAHVALCPDCRDLHGATQCLLASLRMHVPPQPPADLLERIYQSLLGERARAARRRRLLINFALAASLLLTPYAVYITARSVWIRTAPRELTQSLPQPAPTASPSLQRRIEEAGLAVVALTRQTADETVGQTKLLLPVSVPQAAVADVPEWDQAFQPPARSLREIQEGMSAGLEPVATSARRAIGLFLREIPPVESRIQ